MPVHREAKLGLGGYCRPILNWQSNSSKFAFNRIISTVLERPHEGPVLVMSNKHSFLCINDSFKIFLKVYNWNEKT